MSPKAAARFLIGLLVIALVLWCLYLLLGMFALPYPINQIIMVILFLVALGWLLNWLGVWTGP